jgi:hypothetical protein
MSLFLGLKILANFIDKKGLSAMALDINSLRSRLEAVGISQNTFAAYAKVHDADVSRVVRGLHVAKGPVERITLAIAALEVLVSADVEVRIDMSTVANIKAAQKRLAAKREAPATAPWSFRGAVAAPEDSLSAVVVAGQTLAGATAE